MVSDEEKDRALKGLEAKRGVTCFNTKRADWKIIQELIDDGDLILMKSEAYGDDSHVEFTGKGKNIQSNGGYVKHAETLEKQRLEAEKDKKFKRIKDYVQMASWILSGIGISGLLIAAFKHLYQYLKVFVDCTK